MDAQRILVIQLRQLGDTLLTTPLLRALRRLYPAAQIDMLCQPNNACIVEHHPVLTQIHQLPRRATAREVCSLAVRLRRQRYDVVVDPQSLAKTAILTWATGARQRYGFHRPWRGGFYTATHSPGEVEYVPVQRLRLLHDPRVAFDDVELDFYVGAADRAMAAEFRRRWFRGPVAALYGTRTLEQRRWPAEHFAAIADRLADRGFQPYLLFGPGEEAMARQIADAMRSTAIVDYTPLPLPALKAVLEHCALMITCDGGPKHIAVSARIPTITLYHAYLAIAWNPRSPLHRVVACGLPENEPRVIGTTTRHSRIWDIPVEAVWGEVEQVLSARIAAA